MRSAPGVPGAATGSSHAASARTEPAKCSAAASRSSSVGPAIGSSASSRNDGRGAEGAATTGSSS